MTAPMFARSIDFGPPCQACAVARRRIVTAGNATPVHLSIIRASTLDWYVCLVCDQAAADMPSWRIM
jgi:hypothetical protein